MNQEIRTGDYVRSYDFPGLREDCFVEGTVLGVDVAPGYGQPGGGCEDGTHYAIKVERRVVENKEIKGNGLTGLHEDIVYPPVNGMDSWLGGVTEGVVKLVDRDAFI